MYNQLRLAIFRCDYPSFTQHLLDEDECYSILDTFEPESGLPDRLPLDEKEEIYILLDTTAYAINKTYLGDAFSMLRLLSLDNFPIAQASYLSSYFGDTLQIINLLINLGAEPRVGERSLLTYLCQPKLNVSPAVAPLIYQLKKRLIEAGSAPIALRHAIYRGDYLEVADLLSDNKTLIDINQNYSFSEGVNKITYPGIKEGVQVSLLDINERGTYLFDALNVLDLITDDKQTNYLKLELTEGIENTIIIIRLLLEHGACQITDQANYLLKLHSLRLAHARLAPKVLYTLTHSFVEYGYPVDRPTRGSLISYNLLGFLVHVKHYNFDYLRLCLDNGMPVESRIIENFTPLMIAVLSGCMKSIRLLLDLEASFETTCTLPEDINRHSMSCSLSRSKSINLLSLMNDSIGHLTFDGSEFNQLLKDPKCKNEIIELISAERILRQADLKPPSLLAELRDNYGDKFVRRQPAQIEEMAEKRWSKPLLQAYYRRYNTNVFELTSQVEAATIPQMMKPVQHLIRQ